MGSLYKQVALYILRMTMANCDNGIFLKKKTGSLKRPLQILILNVKIMAPPLWIKLNINWLCK